MNVKADFPIFQHFRMQKLPFVYLDSAATTQLPGRVIDRMADFYREENSSTNRGIYPLGWQATQTYEKARETVARYLGAAQSKDIIFTAGVTHSINLVAQSYLEKRLKKGDQVVVSVMEHHANFIPWQQLCHKKGAELLVMDLNPLTGKIEWDRDLYFSSKVKFIACGLVSNVWGVRHPIEQIAERAKECGIPVLVDAAQGLGEGQGMAAKLGVDFIALSGHKMFGPTGIGGLWVDPNIQNAMEPIILGGGMVADVSEETTIFSDWPSKLEAGTPNTAGAAGLAAGLEYWMDNQESMMMGDRIKKWQLQLVEYLLNLGGTAVYSSLSDGRGIISFSCDWCHPHDLVTFLGEKGICIRAGHHCAQPLMKRLSVGSLSRVSLGYYNDEEDLERFCEGMKLAQKFFK